MLGVAFFSGLKATGPDMLLTADTYFKKYQLAHFSVQSTYGLDETDKKAIQAADDVKHVEMGYSADVLLKNSNLVTKVFSVTNDTKLNQYQAIAGRLPDKGGEIALDSKSKMRKHYKLGDRVTFVDSDGSKLTKNFRTATYTIVGFVKTPMYIQKGERGSSTIGTGQTDAFAVVPKEDFDLPVYTQMNITFKQLAKTNAYSESYKTQSRQAKEAVKNALQDQPKARLAKIKTNAQKKIDAGKKELRQARQKLAKNQAKLDAAKAKLADARAKYEHGKTELANRSAAAQAKLAQADRDLQAAKAKLARAKAKIVSGEEQLSQAEEELKSGKEGWQQAKKQVVQVKSAVKTARNLLQQAKKQNNIADLSHDRNGIKKEITSTIEEMDLAKEEKRTLKQALSEYEGELDDFLKQTDNADVSDKDVQQGLKFLLARLNQADRYLDQMERELAKEKRRIDQGEKTLSQKKAALASAKTAYANGQHDYQAGLAKWNAGKQTYQREKAAGEAKLAAALKEITAGEANYQTKLALFHKERAKAEKRLAKAEKDLQIEQERLDALKKPHYFVLDRNTNPGYSEYQENADRLSSMSTIFPIFFFLIAALVCLTTMTRMIEEQRTQIGTLKALGYTNGSIILKYLVYGSLASVFGGIAGIIIGFQVFPSIIFNAYKTMYTMPDITLGIYWGIIAISLLVAIACTTLTAFIACRTELRANASVLMRPRAPKSGKRILLERVKFLWRRMNFTSKVTARNLFRYKQRMLMTVLGVAGCTALILTGFGLRDSISNIADRQYGDIMRYDAAINLDETAPKTARATYRSLMQDTTISSRLEVSQNNLDAVKNGTRPQNVSVIVPKQMDEFADFIVLRDRVTHKRESIPDNGAVLNEKLARLYHVKAGDHLTVRDGSNTEYKIKVTAITENYAFHYLYMKPAYYEKIFSKKPVYNLDLLHLKDTSSSWQNAYAEKLVDSKAVLGVTYSNTVSSLLDNTLDSLDVVIVVLIASAALLAFVVLYNLTNINISERVRELSTIKVLGFYPKEVTMYVYRENIILTLMGIFVGFFAGAFLHRFVITTAEVDQMMFSPSIGWLSYLYSALLTLLFAAVVMIVMHIKLKRIDMIEALKSVE